MASRSPSPRRNAEVSLLVPPEAALAEGKATPVNRRKSLRQGRRRTLLDPDAPAGESISTGVRLRPLLPHERLKDTGVCVDIRPSGRVTISEPQRLQVRTYECDFALDSSDPSLPHFADQEECYRRVGLNIVERASEGFNCCLCAYGQTGTGKTHTIQGDWSHAHKRGLLPRITEGLLAKLGEFRSLGAEVRMRVSYVEVYNDRLYDLLGVAGSDRPGHPAAAKRGGRLEIHTHPTIGMYVDNLSEPLVRDFDGVARLVAMGDRNKRVAATSMNAQSSRSHCIFTFKLEVRNRPDGEGHLMATVQVVDLAGRENEQTSECTGDRFRELTFINRSLFQLANCINALGDGARDHVPFRNSKLTMLLSESFQRNCRTHILATLTPSSLGYEDNLLTCRFLESAGQVRTEPVANRFCLADLKGQLQGELERMRKQLGFETLHSLPPQMRLVIFGRVQQDAEARRVLSLAQQALLRRLSETISEDGFPKAPREAQLRGACQRVGRSLRSAAGVLERLEEVNMAAGSVLCAADRKLSGVEESLQRLQEEVSGKERGQCGMAAPDRLRLPPLVPRPSGPTPKADDEEAKRAPVVTIAVSLPPIIFV